MFLNRKIFVFIFILIFSNILLAQKYKDKNLNRTLWNPIQELTNNKIKLLIEDNTGKYYLKTIDNKNILYIDSTRTDFFTSHLNLKIDDSIYSNEPNISKLSNTDALTGAVVLDTNYALINYKIKNNKIHIIQKTYPVNYYGLGALFVEIIVKNNDYVSHDIGALIEYDLQVNRNDGVYFKTNNKNILKPTLITKDSMPFIWRAYEKENDEKEMMVQGLLKGSFSYQTINGKIQNGCITIPDEIIFDEWDKLYNTLWDYSNSSSSFSDGALIIKWNPKKVLPDSSISFTAFIGITKGSLTDGNIILNCYNVEELVYNGKRYFPDPINYNVIVYNNSNTVIHNINGSIVLPYGIYTDSITKKALPSNLLPINNSLIRYSLHPKMTTEEKNETIEVFVTSDEYSNNSSSILFVPSAPDADTLDPFISIKKTNCSFLVSVKENRKDDKGIDSIFVLYNNNFIYNYSNFIRGDTSLEIYGFLDKPDNEGEIQFRVFDLAGNVSNFSVKIEPDVVGFDEESFSPGNLIYIPFKIKKKSLYKKDTTLYCRLEYDGNYLTPLAEPVKVFNNNIFLTNTSKGSNAIEFNLSSSNGFNVGTVAYLVFSSKSNFNDSTKIFVKEVVLNNNTNYCIYKSDATIRFNSEDKTPPSIKMKQFGSRFYGTATENNLNDKGLYYIYLSDATNSILFTDFSEPGIKSANFVISSIDSSQMMKGDLAVIDGSGNLSVYYFQIEPALVKIDTMIASSMNNIFVSPYFYGELPDLDLHEYSFGIQYDTSILQPVFPYFDMSGCSGNDYVVKIDSSVKGSLRINASGNSFLTLGKIINLHFFLKIGKDTTTKVRFDYFYLKNGLKAVHTTDGVIIRRNLDKTAPCISYEQTRNSLLVTITENSNDDIGLDSIEIDKTHNFSILLLLKTDTQIIYKLTTIDTTKKASCLLVAYDKLGNSAYKELSIYPLKIILPDSIHSAEDSLDLVVYIKPTNLIRLNQLSFKIKIDTNFFLIKDTIKWTNYFPSTTSLNYDKHNLFLIINYYSNILMDTIDTPLFRFTFQLKPNNKKLTELFLYDIKINHDSLFAYSNKSYLIKNTTDTTKPIISLVKYGCEYNLFIYDKGGIGKVWIDSLNNIIDTIIYQNNTKLNDTVVNIKIFPIDSKKESHFKVYTHDLLENVSSLFCSLYPVELYLPLKTKILVDDKNSIPVLIKNQNRNQINNTYFRIKYNENLVKPDSNFIELKNTICMNSKVFYQKISNNLIEVYTNGKHLNDTLPFLIFNFLGIGGDTLTDNLYISNLSVNNDSICSFSNNGLIYRSKLNYINIGVQALNEGKIGKETIIPIYIDGDYSNYNFTKIELNLSFNPTLLKPLGIVSEGTGLEEFSGSYDYNISGKLYLSFIGNGKIKEKLPLTKFASRVLLGTSDSTSIKIDSFLCVYSNNLIPPVISYSDGIFIIKDKYEWQKGLRLNQNFLFQNHPNPYNSTTIIKFYLKENSKTELIIFDVLGREIAKPINNILEAGEHSIVFHSVRLPSGVYYYLLKTDTYKQVRKMVLLK